MIGGCAAFQRFVSTDVKRLSRRVGALQISIIIIIIITTYFASVIWKMCSLQHTPWTELVHKAKLMELMIYKVSRWK